MRTIANLKECGGWLFVRADGRGYVSAEEMDVIAARLKKTARELRKQGVPPDVLGSRVEAAGYRRYCSDIAWRFPESRRGCRGLRTGVYFLGMSSRPGQIKVGYTEMSIMQRIRSLENQYRGESTLFAIALTQNPAEVERYYHLVFADHQVDGQDWFVSRPVIEYLTGQGMPVKG